MGELLDRRRSQTVKRTQELQGQLTDAEKLVADRACVYMTGSFGRGEAGEHCDLDLFIAGRDDNNEPLLQNLDETLVKADLIKATGTLHIPEFSGQGEYLQHYSVSQLVQSLGTSEDDAKNTFKARLLLLLESRCLLGQKT